jgi:hypothetical protein
MPVCLNGTPSLTRCCANFVPIMNYYELTQAFDIGCHERGDGYPVHLQLWSPSVTKDVKIFRHPLNPTTPGPHTFRHTICGIGLIQLQFGGLYLEKNTVMDSHYGHWNEAGARQRSGASADAVDWNALARLSGRIQRHLRIRMAVAKVEGRPILPAAFTALQGGRRLWRGNYSYTAQSPEIQLNGRDSK